MRSALKLLLLAIVLPAVLLEAGLQITAAVVWLRNSRRVEPVALSLAADENRVLCLGDSFTFGMGSSSGERTYPAQLEKQLAERSPHGWRVVNRGWPGLCSRDLLSQIDAQFAEIRPKVVAILIGTNDRWQAVGGIARPESRGFHWEWRTARLVRVVLDRIRGSHEAAPPVALAESREPRAGRRPSSESVPAVDAAKESEIFGDWRAGKTIVRLDRDGHLRMAGRSFPLSLQGDCLTVEIPGAGSLALRATVENRKLCLMSSGRVLCVLDAVPSRRALLASKADLVARAWQALSVADLPRSLSCFQEALAMNPQDPGVRVGMVGVLHRLGRDPETKPLLLWLRERYEARPESADDAEPYAQALVAVDDRAAAEPLLKKLMDVFPERPNAWCFAIELKGRSSDWEQVYRYATQLIAITNEPHARVRGLRARAVSAFAVQPGSDRQRIRDIVEAFTIDADEHDLAIELRRGGARFTDADVEAALADLKLPEAGASAVRRLAAEARRNDGDVVAALEANLETLVEHCRQHGAQAILLSYPSYLADVYPAVREAAARSGAWFVNASAHFGELLKTRARDELFVPDGHLNDEGYRILAELVANEIQRRTGMDRKDGARR